MKLLPPFVYVVSAASFSVKYAFIYIHYLTYYIGLQTFGKFEIQTKYYGARSQRPHYTYENVYMELLCAKENSLQLGIINFELFHVMYRNRRDELVIQIVKSAYICIYFNITLYTIHILYIHRIRIFMQTKFLSIIWIWMPIFYSQFFKAESSSFQDYLITFSFSKESFRTGQADMRGNILSFSFTKVKQDTLTFPAVFLCMSCVCIRAHNFLVDQVFPRTRTHAKQQKQ